MSIWVLRSSTVFAAAATVASRLAGLTLVRVNLDRLASLNLLKESAGSSGDDYGRLFCCKFFLDCCFCLSKVIRIYYSYSVDAHCTDESFEVDLT